VRLLKDWFSLHPIRFPIFMSGETWGIIDI
jgi:hypothetical protein